MFDFNDLSQSKWILPSGQCGYYGNTFYDDHTKEYLDGRFRPMLYTSDQSRKAQLSQLQIVKADPQPQSFVNFLSSYFS
jgi:acyl-homoserine lactone acylase PvdQ